MTATASGFDNMSKRSLSQVSVGADQPRKKAIKFVDMASKLMQDATARKDDNDAVRSIQRTSLAVGAPQVPLTSATHECPCE